MKTLAAALATALLFSFLPAICHSEDLTTEQMIEGLKPKKLTRSLSGGSGGLTAEQKAKLQGLLSRSIGVVQREEIAATVAKAELPKLDFEIYFDFGSADISAQSRPTLDKLGVALSAPELAGMTYLVNGHTDAKGSDAFNQTLSERRAESVVSYLSQAHGIHPHKLKALGYGELHLKDPADPEGAINRRVEIVNLTY